MGFYKGKNVLVTGGTGMIGRPLVELLLAEGARVRVASMDDPGRCPAGAEFMKANLIHWEECQKVVKDMDFVFNVVGIKGSVGIGVKRSASFMVPHLLFNTHMMEAARQAKVERYLYTSSIGVYPPAEIFYEDDAFKLPPDNSDRFAAYAKRVGELQAEAYGIEFGWDKIAIVRPANVYGPGDNFDPKTAMVVPALMARVVGGENPLVVWGDGSAVRDLIYSRDCAKGMMLAMEKGACLKAINLGSGKGYSIKQVVETLCSLFKPSPTVQWDTARATGGKIRLMDMRRAKELIGFVPETSLEQGLRETLDWYLANKDKADKRYNVFHQKNYMEK
ncbi:MAG TPA: NAD(P)-dependent oxidoreductase [Elusimicrobiota bacterium]|nr:NAD(P)-dependent oxidoreductase [Elusimicrobiota bacterium]